MQKEKEEATILVPEEALATQEQQTETTEKKNMFRITAGVLYGIYAIFQVFLNIYCMQVSLVGIPGALQAELLFTLGATAMAVWMFSGDGELSTRARRAIIAGTALVIVFELLTYQVQTTLLLSQVANLGAYGQDNFYYTLLSFLEKPIWRFAVLLARMLLLVLAAFFAMNPVALANEGEEEETEEEQGDAEDDPTFEEADVSPEKATEAAAKKQKTTR